MTSCLTDGFSLSISIASAENCDLQVNRFVKGGLWGPTTSANRISLAKAAIWSTPSLTALANYNMWDRQKEPYWNLSRGITAT